MYSLLWRSYNVIIDTLVYYVDKHLKIYVGVKLCEIT